MSLIPCNECQKEISPSAIICPCCGCVRPFKGVTLSQKESKGMRYKEQMSFIKAGGKIQTGKFSKFCLFLCFVIFIYIIAAGIGSLLGPATPEQIEKEQAKSARIACIIGINKLLDNPDTAEYKHGPGDRIVIKDGKNKWLVQLKLTTRNSFNATVPLSIQCDISKDGQDYKLLSIRKIN